MANILVVSQNPTIVRACAQHWDTDRIVTAATGLDAAKQLAAATFVLVVLDLNLPEPDAFGTAKLLGAQGKAPIILLPETSAADPFSDDGLMAAIGMASALTSSSHNRSDQRSGHSTDANCVRLGSLVLDRQQWQVAVGGQAIGISPRELRLLDYLLTTPQRVHTREAIIEHVWGADFDGSDRVVDVSLSRLRRQLLDRPDCPVSVRAVFGIGYRLVIEPDCDIAWGAQT